MTATGVPLADLLSTVSHSSVTGPLDITVTGCTCDSREVRPGDIFVALSGFNTDGRLYVDEAVRRGASAVLAHGEALDEVPAGVTWIVSPRAREAFSALASAVYRTRSTPVKTIGVTGTNGKTTVAYLLRSIFREAGGAGLLGTIEYDDGEGLKAATRTTPEAHHIHRWLRTLEDRGLATGIMEVSSHSIVLARVRDVTFDVAAFTNLTRDHLDFHHTMEAYYQAKRGLFDLLSKKGTAVVNLDDPYGARLATELKKKTILGIASRSKADVRPTACTMDLDGIKAEVATPFGPLEIRSRLTGHFNLLNILVASAAALACGATPEQVHDGIAGMEGVPGRMERVDAGQPFAILVDFAHTDDALRNLLQTLRELKPERIITVFGCGGDRDSSKRPLMGAVVTRLSDVIVLTSDNPRTENPAAIVKDVEAGIRPELGPQKRYHCDLDRREAIKKALSLAKAGDVVVVAGKGHERVQIIGTEHRPFHDPTVLRELLSEMTWP